MACLLTVTMMAGFSPESKALTLGVPIVFGEGGVAVSDGEYMMFVLGGIAVMAISGPMAVLGWLLDDAGNSNINNFAHKIEEYGASKKEALNLAVLLSNNAQKEQNESREITISNEELVMAAPVFVRTSSFQKLVSDISETSK